MKLSEYKVYIYVALFFGILFIILTPPFNSPDENSHFKRAYQISKGHLYPIEKKKVLGNYFPKEMVDYIDGMSKYMGDRDKKYSFSSMVAEEQKNMNYDKKVFNRYSTVTFVPFVYFAPALGIVFAKVGAKILGMDMLSTSVLLYFARFFSLLVTIIITSMAIKITPIMKKTFLTVGLLPMFVFLSSMVSYDNILDSSLLLGLAIILKLTYEKKKIEKKDIIALSIIGTVLLTIKTVYFPIFLLMFVIPAKKFTDKKQKIKTALILLGCILVTTAIFKLPYLFLDNSGMKKEFISKQISFIMHHPLKYSVILFENIRDQRFYQLSGTVGLFGLLDVYNPTFITLLIYINLFAIGLSEGTSEKIKISKVSKIIIVGYIIFAIVSVFSALYITWTPHVIGKTASKEISGVQGRYFIPILMPLLLLFSNERFKDNKVMKCIRENYILVPVIVLMVSTCAIILRFWV